MTSNRYSVGDHYQERGVKPVPMPVSRNRETCHQIAVTKQTTDGQMGHREDGPMDVYPYINSTV